jgi:hypothetical protein
MYSYRQRAATKATGSSAIHPACPLTSTTPKTEYWEDLTAQYGLDSMDADEANGHTDQTVDEEYSAYVTALLSPKGTDLIKFWEVLISE